MLLWRLGILTGNILREYVSLIRYAVVLKLMQLSVENMNKILSELGISECHFKRRHSYDDDYYAKFGEIYFAYTLFVLYLSIYLLTWLNLCLTFENDEAAKRIIR